MNVSNRSRLISAPRLCKLLKQVAKTVVCLLLCVALVWGYSYKEPTEAHATAVVAVVGAVAVAAAVAALGICVNGVVNNETYAQSCQKIWDDMDSGIRNKVTCAAIAAGAVGNVVGSAAVAQYNLTAEFLTAVGNQITTAYNTAQNFLAMTSLERLPHGTQLVSGSVNANTMAEFFGTEQAYIKNNMETLSTPFTVVDAVSVNQYVGEENALVLGNQSGGYQYRIYTDSGKLRVKTYNLTNGKLVDDFNPYVNLLYVCTLVNYSSLCYVLAYRQSQEMTYILAYPLVEAGAIVGTAPGHDVYGIPAEDVYADGYSALNHPVSDVVGKVGDAVGVTNPDGTKSIPIPVPSTGVSTQTQSQTQSDALGTDISDAASTELNKTTNAGKNTSLPKPGDLPDLSLPMLLTRKFPFSLPWDLYASVKMLAATPTTPVYTIPFLHIPAWGVNQDITIDMSKFESVAAVCRWGFSAMWIVGLIFLTRKLIWK